MDFVEGGGSSGDGDLCIGECGHDGGDRAEAWMDLVGDSLSKFLLHVGHVPNDLCSWNSWIGGEIEIRVLVHRDGDYGWSPLAQSDGLVGRRSGYVDGISCSYGLLCSGGSLRIYLAETQWKPRSVGQSLISITS